MQDPVRIQVCGQFVVELGGRAVELASAGRQGRVVLAYLTLHHGHAVGRDRLYAVVWPEHPPSQPNQAFSAILSKLRRDLGADVVTGALALQLAPHVRVDLEEAERALEQAQQHLDEGRWEPARQLARVGLDVVDRGLLEGYDDDWIDRPRRELVGKRVHGRECIVAASLALGGPALSEAERRARELVDLEPLRESSAAMLMRTLEARGNVAQALLVYDSLRQRLADEIGTVPGPEIRELHHRLLDRDAAPRPATDEPPRAASAMPSFAIRSHEAFVGREPEIQRLRGYLELARAGRRRLVLLAGEPGIGKTRLAEHFAAECQAAGVVVLYGRCDEDSTPFQPFKEALRHHLRTADGDELLRQTAPYAAELAGFLPELASRDGGSEPAGARPEPDRARLFEGIAALLATIARSQPVLLVLDDLHWADKSTLLLLRQVVRYVETSPLLILGTYRDSEMSEALHGLLAGLLREHVYENIALRGLAAEDFARLVPVLSNHQAPSNAVRALWEETRGNPFFLEEMLRHLADRAVGDGGSWPDAGWPADEAVLPPRIKEVIAQRLVHVSPALRRLLEVAAVMGSEFRIDLLERIDDLAGLSDVELDELLREGLDAHLIAEVAEYGHYVFSHSLVRQTLYEGMSATRRARVHLRIGVALESLAAEDPGYLPELARHFLRAPPGHAGKAVDYATRAAARTLGLLAFEEAARLYSMALEALERSDPGDPRRLSLLLAQGDAQRKAGDTDAARDTFREAGVVARATEDADALGQAALGYGGTSQMAGGVVDPLTVALLEEALDALGEQETALRARLLARLAVELSFSDLREQRAALTEEAIEIADRAGDPGTRSYVLIARHWSLWGPENLDERLTTARRLLQLGEETRDQKIVLQGHRWCMMHLLERGDVTAAEAEVDMYIALAEERRRPSERWYGYLYRAMLLLLAGRLADAERLIDEGERIGERVQEHNARQGVVLQRVALRREQGRLAEVESAVRDNVERYPAIPGWHSVLAHVCIELGRPDEAQRELARFAAGGFRDLPHDGIWLGAIGYLAETSAALGDRAAAARLRDLLLPYAGRNITVGWTSTCAGSASRHLGLLAATLGLDEEARRHFDAALEMNARMGAAPWVARTQIDYAELLLAGDRPNDRRTAIELLELAHVSASALDMVAPAARARRLLDESAAPKRAAHPARR
jgi:DNA-binding SARP family transcriptional activator